MANTTKIEGEETKTRLIDTPPKDILTLELLQDKVLEGIQYCHDNGGEEIRNFDGIRQLLNFLFDYSIKQTHYNGGDAKDVSTLIDMDLKANDLLLGYTHFLCSSDTNPFNWSYLLECCNRFANYLCRFASYIVWVTRDMNALLPSLYDKKELTFVIDGYLVLHTKVEGEMNIIEANIVFDELYRIYSISTNGYRLKVLYVNKVVGVFWRDYNSKLDEVIDFVRAELCHCENI